ncbi:hypothetical protein KR044_002695 [Drosophila immigrans]|nr:hypothetical protein KR044_002695 [Drosophila immigrans]
MSEDKDAWDDTLLVKAYDDSVNLARETLARRIADSTNRRPESEADDSEKPEEQKPFKVGDFARATYTDGLDYEGTVVSMDEQAESCILRYVGYENEQEIALSELLPSWGADARRLQQKAAKKDAETEEPAQRATSFKKSTVAKGKQPSGSRASGLNMPPMPLVPPMFSPSSSGVDGEPDQDFVAMLTAWYMSGYYTGLYQGKKEGSAKKKAAKK